LLANAGYKDQKHPPIKVHTYSFKYTTLACK
jgi:hypothetical protein